ncbi:TIGR03086 family metal-binding protein [Amycolatopsis anabasis]|uniref:TIGR03086 family metal-binding protein n=1 Tax=Amycolatopsis anabasis TaxID=1840409 RepID=UPI00131B30B9|nr:TIGR03086 family metal-binding protein [Amycolatopsis anabasis]
MELLDAHGQALRGFDDLVHRIEPGQWAAPTPCPDWNVRDLVNHLVAEQLWVPHLLAGATLAEIGDRFDGDVLGDDPVAAWEGSAAEARRAWTAPGAVRRRVQVTGGEIGAAEYGWQMTVDLAVHGWDLATAIGAPQPIGEELARRLIDEFGPQVESWQGLGIFAPPVKAGEDASAPDRLVALLGRAPG